VALIVTLLASACGGGDTKDCAAFFGAAALPRFAAMGAAAWAWIMYAGALGCQTLLNGGHPLTAACVLAMVPWLARSMLVDTCGDPWRMCLCEGVSVTLINNGTASAIEADCSRLSLNLWVLGLGTAVGALTACVPVTFVRLMGAAATGVAVVSIWAVNTSSASSAYFGTLMALTVLSCVGDLWALVRATLLLESKNLLASSANNNSNEERVMMVGTQQQRSKAQ
jgi:hypothetical protein